MFGYITVNKPELKVKELELYRSYYCGLCAELHRRYGRRGQLLLSYDCTFLAILLTGMYEPGETERMGRCVAHPAVLHREMSSRYTKYAADMNVLLGWLKAADDWQDEHKASAKAAAILLRKDYLSVRAKWPRQEEAVRTQIRALSEIEKAGITLRKDSSAAADDKNKELLLAKLDEAAGTTGKFLGQLCAVHEDIWAPTLEDLGFYLGKFVYITDAFDDMEKDSHSGNFNILNQLKELDPEAFEETVKSILIDTAARCCRSFEKLPIVKNVELLRNVLYSGIWVRYHQIRSGDRKQQRAYAACDTIYRR